MLSQLNYMLSSKFRNLTLDRGSYRTAVYGSDPTGLACRVMQCFVFKAVADSIRKSCMYVCSALAFLCHSEDRS